MNKEQTALDVSRDIELNKVMPQQGYVLVPTRPTVQMILAGQAADTHAYFVSDSYCAMIAAAPKVEAVPQQGAQEPNLSALQDVLHLLQETEGFVSVSPRGKENLNAAIELLDAWIVDAIAPMRSGNTDR